MTKKDHLGSTIQVARGQRVFWASITAALVLGWILLASSVRLAQAAEVSVYDGHTLHRALRLARAGDQIVLYPGDYRGIRTESPNNKWHYFYSHRSGTASAPIVVRSYSRDDMQLLSGTDLNSAGYVLYLTGNHWRFRDLRFRTGQKGIMLDSASHNVFDNIEVAYVRDEGIHFRSSSSNNVLRNCYVHHTGRLKPGFGEAVYVGSHEGDRLGDHSNNNRIGGCRLGPAIAAEAVDVKAGTINTIIEHNVMIGDGISGENYADSFIDVKGNHVIVRHNRMHWRENRNMDHGIHMLKREHRNSNIYQNTVTLGRNMPFLKIGRGTVHASSNRLNYDGPLATFYSSGAIDATLDRNLPATHSYTGFRDSSEAPEPRTCLRLQRDRKVEVDMNTLSSNCVDVTSDLSGRLLQVWDSNANPSCNFRGTVVASDSGATFAVNANYAGTRAMTGQRLRITAANGCPYLIMRWL